MARGPNAVTTRSREERGLTAVGVFSLAWLFAFAVIEGTITCWILSQYNTDNNSPSSKIKTRLRYLAFCSWWTVFFCILYIVAFFFRFMGVFASIASHVVWVFMTWVFWLAGAAAITNAYGGGIRCGHRHFIYCHQLVAAEAFAWIEWILFCFWFAWTLFLLVKAWRSHEGVSRPMQEV